ncbi:MAG TPA: trypsin-like peptidase domain-containing protein [Gemmatimonadales bacterium]|jgi:serine protease Do|nr:trypsin-like peptidase domain-containing protein [Gemmatimonadales bacterium]
MRALATSCLLAGVLASCQRSSRDGIIPPASAQRSAENATLSTSRKTAVVDAANRVAPAVVSITVTSLRRVSERGPWDFFFIPRETQRLVQSSGTGFVVKPDGVIITNQHVVAAADSITVTLPDGTSLPGKLVGEDPTTDIAVVRVPRTGMPVVPLGTSSDLMIGEWVVALGDPYAYLLGNAEPTVTAGVVSATHRNILPNDEQPGLYLDMIQTDAAINPGNSGGPLANALGEVVGVNSSIFTGGGGSSGSIGLGFAIPIERALRVADEILRTGNVRRAWTGLDVAGPDAMQDWRRQGGVTVTRVVADGPAARGGITEGAVLVEVNGRRLHNYLDWEAVKLDLHVGDEVRVRLLRGGTPEERKLTTGDLPTSTATKVTVLRGLEVVTVTQAIQGERRLRTAKGALIVGISDEARRGTGLQAGDVILAINRSLVTSARQVADLLEASRSDQAFRIYFERSGMTVFTDLVFGR